MIISVINAFISIAKFKIDIDIIDFIYFNYKKLSYVRKNYNV